MENELNIVCTIDESYVKHCGVMLFSLFQNNPNSKFHVYLITDGLSDSSWRKIQDLGASFKQRITMRQLDVSILSNARVSDHISLATYYRLLIPRVLPETIERALFLDSDIVILRDIREFYEQPLDGFTHAAVATPFTEKDVARLGMPAGTLYFNAGVLLLNLNLWRKENLSNQLVDYVDSHSEGLIWWDQDALNLILQNRWRGCAAKWNASDPFFHGLPVAKLGVSEAEYREAVDQPCILHFSGAYKPWMHGCPHPLKSEYFKYLQQTVWNGEGAPTAGLEVKRRIGSILKSWAGLRKLLLS